MKSRILHLFLAMFLVCTAGQQAVARYYEPLSGRFISADPLGHGASMSLYDYANGDPVNGLDPDGRCGNSALSGMDSTGSFSTNSRTASGQMDLYSIERAVSAPAAAMAGQVQAWNQQKARDLASGDAGWQLFYAIADVGDLIVDLAQEFAEQLPYIALTEFGGPLLRGAARVGGIALEGGARSAAIGLEAAAAKGVADASIRSTVLANIAESQAARASSNFAAYASREAQIVSKAAEGLTTGADEAVFWSGIGRGGADKAAAWAAQNGGATLESTLASRGITLPVWDASNSATVAAWRNASVDFAAGAKGNIRVLQGDALRIDSIWKDEFNALKTNTNVNSIRSIHPETGAEVLLWSR